MRTHKVGTITLGLTMIGIGVLYIVGLFTTITSYQLIFHAWPGIFIMLGIEILLSNFRAKDTDLTFDVTSIVLIVVLTFFAMFLALFGQAANLYLHF